MSALFRVIITVARLSGFLSLTLLLGPLQFLSWAILPRFGHVIPMLSLRPDFDARRTYAMVRCRLPVLYWRAIMFRGLTLWQSARKCLCLLLPNMRLKHGRFLGNWPICNVPYTLSVRGSSYAGQSRHDERTPCDGDRLVLSPRAPLAMARAQPFKSALFSSVQRGAKPGRILSSTR